MPMSKLSDAAKETVQDARAAIRESGEAAAAASGDIQADLQALRDDVTRLAQEIADILAVQGGKAWHHARAGVDEAMADAEDGGRDAADALREVGDNMRDAIDKSLQERPYTTLALALGLGFLLGATWRR
jgi:ElaB/YqjD/DUF883 family membrane-anchored ribosome-binding protein